MQIVFESELSTLLNRPPVHNVTDLRTWLPSSDALWQAPTADAWSTLYASENIAAGPRLCDIVHTVVQGYTLPPTVSAHLAASSFSQSVLLQAFHMGVWYAHQLRALTSPSLGHLLYQDVRRCLQSSMLTDRSVKVWYSTGGPSALEAAVGIRYHFAMLSTLVPTERLQKWVSGLGVRNLSPDHLSDREEVIICFIFTPANAKI